MNLNFGFQNHVYLSHIDYERKTSFDLTD